MEITSGLHFKKNCWGAWGAQLVKRPIVGFGSGWDLRVVRLSPALSSAESGTLPAALLPTCRAPSRPQLLLHAVSLSPQ